MLASWFALFHTSSSLCEEDPFVDTRGYSLGGFVNICQGGCEFRVAITVARQLHLKDYDSDRSSLFKEGTLVTELLVAVINRLANSLQTVQLLKDLNGSQSLSSSRNRRIGR